MRTCLYRGGHATLCGAEPSRYRSDKQQPGSGHPIDVEHHQAHDHEQELDHPEAHDDL